MIIHVLFVVVSIVVLFYLMVELEELDDPLRGNLHAIGKWMRDKLPALK